MTQEGICPLCVGRPNDVVVELDAAWIVAPRRAPLPGYVGVVARSHAGEPFELGGLERRRFWNEILIAAMALRDTSGAMAITYEIDGQTRPHVSAHVYARFPGDPFTGRPIDADAPLIERSSDEIERLATAISEAAGSSPPPASTERDAPAAYDDMAAWYDEQCIDGFYNAHYDRPAVLALIGAVEGQRILDVGCGGGHYLAALRDAGRVSWAWTGVSSSSLALAPGSATEYSWSLATSTNRCRCLMTAPSTASCSHSCITTSMIAPGSWWSYAASSGQVGGWCSPPATRSPTGFRAVAATSWSRRSPRSWTSEVHAESRVLANAAHRSA